MLHRCDRKGERWVNIVHGTGRSGPIGWRKAGQELCAGAELSNAGLTGTSIVRIHCL